MCRVLGPVSVIRCYRYPSIIILIQYIQLLKVANYFRVYL